MPLPNPPTTPYILDTPRPWPFSRAELTAGLRGYIGDPTLSITKMEFCDIPDKRPALGRIRGLSVVCKSLNGEKSFQVVIKEPQGTTRAGMAGAGKRELLFYRNLSVQIPVRVPQLLAAHPDGDWMVFNMLPEGILPERWTAQDYLLATQQLAVLHDRFWGLGEDLSAFAWLSRPLDGDFPIYLRATYTGIRRLVDKVTSNLITRDTMLLKMLRRLVENADFIANTLRQTPATLLHGDYWPGNIHILYDRTITVYDWQQTAIGPGILDLFQFVQASRWYFGELPLPVEQIVQHYRNSLAESCGFTWHDDEWQCLWDQALLWTFLSNWVDMLANIPASVLQARYGQMQELWLNPVHRALDRCLPRGS
jgi:hypothetical protein